MISYKIVTLTYDEIYLLLLMLNNDTKNIIYENKKIIFCHDKLRNDNIIPN